MTDHIYGRGESLVPEERPHMFAKEITMYVDYLSERSILADPDTPEWRSLLMMKRNLEKGMTLCLEIAESEPYPGENLDSIRTTVNQQRARLEEMFEISVSILQPRGNPSPLFRCRNLSDEAPSRRSHHHAFCVYFCRVEYAG